MQITDEDVEDLSGGEDAQDESTSNKKLDSKRKSRDNDSGSYKKVKYDDITSDKPKKKNELYKPPTVEELNELKETQNLYNNNLFRLQIEELIKEVKIKNKHRHILSVWLQSFESFLNELPEYSIVLSDLKRKNGSKLSDKDKLINAIMNMDIKCEQDITVHLIKPQKHELFGLDKNKSLPGPKLTVNVNLTMPRECFQVKDYLNNRYFTKRYYYLAYVFHYLKVKDLGGEIRWVYYNSNKQLPVVEINLSDKVTVTIFATPADNYFKPSRCLPDINNVKINVFGYEPNADVATLFYNASLAHDLTLKPNNLLIENSLSELTNLQEAIKLIHIWLAQRTLPTSDLVPYFITYLLAKKRVNKHMSSYQVVRSYWNFIVETDLSKNGISLDEHVQPDTLKSFQANYDVVFLDCTGCYNLTSFLNLGLYKKLKNECEIAFKLLDDGGITSFHSLFITKLPFELQYDLIVNVRDQSNFAHISTMDRDTTTKYLAHWEEYIIKHIANNLEKGFSKRATLIVPLQQTQNTITFGINLNPDEAFGIIERGPALNDPKEREFKEFWGELATDRRFKDGSVCVAVYFQTETVKERRDIVKKIIDWVVGHKLGLDYKLLYNDFEELLINKKITASYPTGTNEECCLRAIAASDDLAKKLRGLEMPLSITGVQGITDTFSFTDVFPPISTSYNSGNNVTTTCENNIVMNEKRIGVCPRFVKPIECVLQLEHSSKWPKDLAGIRHMKTAIYLEISKILAKEHKIVSGVKPDFLEVLYEGYVFRYSLYLSREVGYLKKEATADGAVIYKDTPESRDLEMKLNVLPKLTGALKGLQSQFPSYGPVTALIKRWLRSHLIDHYHFPDEVIHLLSASLFLNQSSFPIPATPQIGFLRFLKFFSELQWHIQPVIVNFNDEITKETVTDIESKLLKNREACPNLFVATPYDGCESLFTQNAPSKEVLKRVRQLASETLTIVTNIIKEENFISVNNLFVPNLEGYNAIIHLRPLLNPRRHEQVVVDEAQGQVTLQGYDASVADKIPVTDFNPIECYLKQLRNNYGDFANFFHDSYGGNVIGVLWIPTALEPKDFKVPNVRGRKLVDGKLVLNLDALLEDFFILGRGIVKSIDDKQ